MYDQDQRNFAYASGTAGPALIILVIFFFVIIGVIYVAIAAVAAAAIILGVANLFDRNNTLSLGEVYSAAFWGLIAYLVITIGAVWLVYQSSMGVEILASLPRDPDMAIKAILKHGLSKQLVLLLIVSNLPGVLAFAGIMSLKLDDPFTGMAGFFKACLTGIIATVVSLIFSAWLIVMVVASVQKSGGFVSFATALLFMGVIAFIFAIVTALLAGVIIMMTTWALAKNRQVGYGRVYGATFLALLAYALLTFIVELLFHGSSKMYNFAMYLAHSKSLWILAERLLALFMHFFPSFILMQLPGLLAAAFIIATRLGPTYRGLPGYLKSLAVTQTTVLISLMVGFLGAHAIYVGL